MPVGVAGWGPLTKMPGAVFESRMAALDWVWPLRVTRRMAGPVWAFSGIRKLI